MYFTVLTIFSSEKVYSRCLLKIKKAMLSHGNGKDCAPFIRLCLELVTMQKCNDTTDLRHKKCSFKKVK